MYYRILLIKKKSSYLKQVHKYTKSKRDHRMGRRPHSQQHNREEESSRRSGGDDSDHVLSKREFD